MEEFQMKTLLKLTIVFTILLFACNAWAQNLPQCEVDANGLPMAPDQGVCFMGPTGGWFIFWINDGSKSVTLFDPSLAGDNIFWRLNSKGKGFEHQHVKDGYFAFLCKDNTKCEKAFWKEFLVWDSLSFGRVTLTANEAMIPNLTESGTELLGTCPSIMRAKGEVTDHGGQGNQTDELQAIMTTVPDHDEASGCSEPIVKIKITPSK
jgi:hypothetical protein